jgi:hypothetical protein
MKFKRNIGWDSQLHTLNATEVITWVAVDVKPPWINIHKINSKIILDNFFVG